MEKQKKKQNGITLIALVISIIVMLILAGVSLNMTIGDNGIIKQAQDATIQTQRAMLQEYIDQYYVENFEKLEDNSNKILVINSLTKSKDWIYKGKLGYVTDSLGYVHYFLIIENMPNDIKNSITAGRGEKTYYEYVNCEDVWGVTEDLRVYYCSSGLNSIDGVALENLSKENGDDIVFEKGSNYAKLITGNADSEVTKSDLRSIQSLKIDASSGISNLNDLYNFASLKEITLENISLDSLDGIEYCTNLYRIYITRCHIEKYNALGKIAPQIQYLFLQDIDDDEVVKLCSPNTGIGGVDFNNLAYFGIYGEGHYSIDYYYDKYVNCTNNENAYHSVVTDISPLSNLSTATKNRIRNLFLNNNSIEDISNLYEFKNVELLRIEANKLKKLDGLYSLEEGYGMTSLTRLHANSNLLTDLVVDATTGNTVSPYNPANNALGGLVNYTYNSTTNTYTFTKRLTALNQVFLSYNNLVHLNYLSPYTSLNTLYIDNISGLNLDSGIQSIISIIEKDSFLLNCDAYVSNYINDNSKKVSKVSLRSKTMTDTEFKTFMSGRGDYLKKLDLTNLKLVSSQNNTITLSTTTTPTFTSVIEEALGNTKKIVALNLYGLSNLSTINFAKNYDELRQIDLRGTGVTDLSPIADHCTKLASVFLDNSSINVANIPDATGKAAITDVEKLFNKCGVSYGIDNSFCFYSNTPGVMLCNKALISKLSNSTNITNFISGFYDLGAMFGDDTEIFYDLSKTKCTYFWYRQQGSKKGDKFKFPSTIQNTVLSNSSIYYADTPAYILDTTNVNSLTNLTYIRGDNCDWNTFFGFASKLPSLNEIYYYWSTIGDYSLANYISGLKKQPLQKLTITGFIGSINNTTLSDSGLSYISQLTSLRYLCLGYARNVKKPSYISSLTNLETLNMYYTGVYSLSFINNLNNLSELSVTNSSLINNTYDFEGNQVVTTDILKAAYVKGLRTVNISANGITADEINSSGIKDTKVYNWTSFSP